MLVLVRVGIEWVCFHKLNLCYHPRSCLPHSYRFAHRRASSLAHLNSCPHLGLPLLQLYDFDLNCSFDWAESQVQRFSPLPGRLFMIVFFLTEMIGRGAQNLSCLNARSFLMVLSPWEMFALRRLDLYWGLNRNCQGIQLQSLSQLARVSSDEDLLSKVYLCCPALVRQP